MAQEIQLAHGGGGYLTRELIDTLIVPRFGDGPLRGLPDGATLASPGERLVFTTDSFVVQPLELSGGCIGDLAPRAGGWCFPPTASWCRPWGFPGGSSGAWRCTAR